MLTCYTYTTYDKVHFYCGTYLIHSIKFYITGLKMLTVLCNTYSTYADVWSIG